MQVSDRRLTFPDGRIASDNTNKATIIYCQDGYFSVAYTGLAVIGKKRTGEWLLDFCAEIGAGSLTPDAIITLLEQYATKALRLLKIDQRYKSLTFVSAGVYLGHRFIMTTTNDSDENGMALPRISDSYLSIGGRIENPYLSIHGSTRTLESTVSRRITKQRKELFSLSGLELADRLVSYIRMARRDSKFGNRVGGDCMSIVILPNQPTTTRYHPMQSSPNDYMPNLVTPEFVIMDAKMTRG